MNTGKHVNICQPGGGASCALCCGSHNYNVSEDEMRRIFAQRRALYREHMETVETRQGSGDEVVDINREEFYRMRPPKRIEDAIQCPYIGYIDDEETLIGCLLYAGSRQGDIRFSNFQNNTCVIFSCLAREILTEEEILYAARLTGDWFYYSLLINDINLLRKTAKEFPRPEDVPEDLLDKIKAGLREAAFCEVLPQP